jgi:hypothetical protein
MRCWMVGVLTSSPSSSMQAKMLSILNEQYSLPYPIDLLAIDAPPHSTIKLELLTQAHTTLTRPDQQPIEPD